MTEVSRRLFLFGSAATLAALTLPAIAATPVPILAPAAHVYKRRHIAEISAGFGLNMPEVNEEGLIVFPQEHAIVSLSRRNAGILTDGCIFQGGLGPGQNLYWLAGNPLCQIIIPENHALEVALESKSGKGLGEIALVCLDYVDDGPPVELTEVHTFPQQGPAEIYFMYPDNSLEARLKRQEDRANAFAEYGGSFDYDTDE